MGGYARFGPGLGQEGGGSRLRGRRDQTAHKPGWLRHCHCVFQAGGLRQRIQIHKLSRAGLAVGRPGATLRPLLNIVERKILIQVDMEALQGTIPSKQQPLSIFQQMVSCNKKQSI